MGYLEILVELIIGYFALFITVKCLGKTQISQIHFDFISALVLGDLVSGAVFHEDISIVKILFSIAVWGFLIFMTDIATQKSRKLRHLFEGKPSIIINHGKIDMTEIKKTNWILTNYNNYCVPKIFFRFKMLHMRFMKIMES